MTSRRIIWSLAAGLAASAIVALSAYAQAHGRWGIWDLLLAAPWPYVAYRIFADGSRPDRWAHASGAAAAEQRADDLAPAYRAATEALACAIGAKDSYVHPHSNRVPRISELIAGRLGL